MLALSGLKLLDVPYANELVIVSLAMGLAALAVWGEPDRPAHAAGAEEVAAYASSALTEPSASGATR